ncbi:class II fructose-bisphosphate aldolase [Pseudactinotalea suaedae]|uniref:class II fructose-bisphosphate aldolase n=1 Tax=Pseudactinotalea suaedae TaxID=1524924 RepID=UPI0012E1FC15|nr:class II fructose-bisphosphate aldolase [Pseudactinotalea suaedae]
MPLVTTRELLDAAIADGAGLAALNVLHLETAEAIAAGAEAAGAGAVLQISENCVRYHGSLAPIAAAAAAVAEASSAPLSLHLDHAEDAELVAEALRLGFSSVMVDGARLAWEDNVALTRRAARDGRAAGAVVEAEIGEIGGKDGAHAPGVRTDPDEAARFAEATGVDLLAVAVGSSHAMTERTAAVDHELIERIAAVVPVPLVLHGSSGVPDSALVAAIRAGMRKINVSTQLNKVFSAAVRERLGDDPGLVDSRKYLGAGRESMAGEVERLIRLFASAGARS